MALVARGVDAGTGINVLADNGALGDMQIVKLGISALGNQGLIPATIADGILVQLSNPTAISSVITSVVPGTGATNLGKAEDAVAGSGDTGIATLWTRADTAAASGANGDYVFPIVDALGKLWTADVQTEDAAASSGDRGSFVLAIRRDTPTSGAAAGDYHEFQVDAVGGLWLAGSQIEDAVAASGDRGLFALAIRRDTATADAANGDYVGLHVDALGKLRITGTYVEDAAAADGQEILGVAAVRRDTQASSSSSDGDWSTLNTDAFGRLRVSDRNEVSVAATTALATNLVVKASAGKLFGFYGYSTATQFIQLHNTASLPADTAVPVGVFPITANTPFSLWLEHPQPCSTGITLCNSSTGPTKTIGSSNTWITALYE
jgi:hypothetical protein